MGGVIRLLLQSTYQKHRKSTACARDGEGGAFANEVYEILPWKLLQIRHGNIFFLLFFAHFLHFVDEWMRSMCSLQQLCHFHERFLDIRLCTFVLFFPPAIVQSLARQVSSLRMVAVRYQQVEQFILLWSTCCFAELTGNATLPSNWLSTRCSLNNFSSLSLTKIEELTAGLDKNSSSKGKKIWIGMIRTRASSRVEVDWDYVGTVKCAILRRISTPQPCNLE